MLAHLLLALLHLPAQAQATPAAPARDTVTAPDSSAAAKRRARKKPPKRAEVTAEHLATAYASPSARDILLLARAARMRQDSSLQSYDATTYQRVSAGLAVSRFARERLAFRNETATKVRWRRGVGAYVDVTGSRTVIPVAGKSGRSTISRNISPIPYYPGSETLWIGASVAQSSVDENTGIVNPLAEGAEAYYTYESGDSVTFRLPGGRTILLRELRVRPRVPKWNLAVGSMWFDMSGGQLVRAAYRMSVPMDIGAVATEDDSAAFNDVPFILKPLMFPMTAQVSALGVEYGLFQGKFWLPRLQVAEGGVQVGPVRVPVKLEQRYQYSDVNEGAPLPPIVLTKADSSGRTGGANVCIGGGCNDKGMAARDSARAARRKVPVARCDSSGNLTYRRTSEGGVNPVFVTISCDSAKLASSPDLPPSIYDAGDEAFNSDEMDALVKQALSMGAQAGFAPQPLHVGLDRPRYNRVEGLSLGVRGDQVLGAGYSVSAAARLGLADWQPNVEATLARSDLRRTRSLTAYNRLVSANDWGNPLSLGRSINALLFGRDEGYYYRATGAELSWVPDEPSGFMAQWSLFAEQERTARQRTTFSLARAVAGTQFDTNVVARRGFYGGGRARFTHSLGLDPDAFRLFSDGRLEVAGMDQGAYGRAALDLTASHGVWGGAAALTLAGGSSVGDMPAQRYWFLGGSQTVRGQAPGAEYGNAFWLARGEVARGFGIARPVLFGDLGWAGDRNHLREVGRPMSGVGVGASFMDGLVRFDVARGIFPAKGWRVESYLEARF